METCSRRCGLGYALTHGGIMNTLQVGNKMLKDLESRLHGDIITVLSSSKDEFKLRAFVTGYAHKGWVAGRPVFEPFKALLSYEITATRTSQGYVINSWSYRGTTGVDVKDTLRNSTYRSTELGRLFGTSDVLGDYVFNEIATAIKVYLNTYF